jgi:MinD superfamily P-loop ATPase
MIEAVRGCDHVLLVGDATPFGLHDMKLAVDTVRQLSIPLGVIINRCDGGDGRTVRYCREESIPILAELPDRRAVAELGSRGQLAAEQLDEYRAALEPVLTDLQGVRS